MFYKFLGYVIWNGGKLFLRSRYGSAYAPKPVLAAGAVAVVGVALAIVASKRNGSGD